MEHNSDFQSCDYVIGPQTYINLKPMDKINGFDVRPGFYETNGAFALPGGVNFTITSQNATGCELLLFHRTSGRLMLAFRFRTITG